MHKIWLIIKHEYTRHVLRKRFLIALLSVPAWLLFSFLIGIGGVLLTADKAAGVVDLSGILQGMTPPESSTPFDNVPLIDYPSAEAAQAALDSDDIDVYFVVADDYRTSGAVDVFYYKQPSDLTYSAMRRFLRRALVQDLEPAVAERLLEGSNPVFQATQEDRSMATGEWLKIAVPIVVAIFLLVAIFTSGGYLLQAVVEEKENRTMEILATSLSPMQIMTGKTIALIAVGLTQVLAWMIVPLIALIFFGSLLASAGGNSIDWFTTLGLAALTGLPTFVLIASLMAAIGATVTEARESQQMSTLVTLPAMLPVMLISVILSQPNGALAVALSLFPLTASLTLLLRMAFATVPTWQIVASVVILLASAVGSLWLAARLFRAGMLRYGKQMNWKEIAQALRPAGRQA